MSTIKYPNQSTTLTGFYNTIHKWILDGFPKYDDNNPLYRQFTKSTGLCNNLAEYCINIELENDYKFYNELRKSFLDAKLHKDVPFNSEPYNNPSYEDEINKYSNPDRLAWIKDHCSLYDKE